MNARLADHPVIHPPLIVGLGGALREGSTANVALLRTLDRVRSLGCQTMAFLGPALPMTIFDPSDPALSEPAVRLVDALRRADGIVLATPSYHGSLTGLLKNALDYAEALRQDERVYFQDRAVGCIVCADGPQAMGPTLTALRSIVHALRGWPTPYGAAIASQPRPFGATSAQDDPAALKACETVADEVVSFALRVRAGPVLTPVA